MLAGICAGISEATGIDVTIVRIGVALLALGSILILSDRSITVEPHTILT